MPELSFFQEGHRLLWKLNSVLTGITCIKILIFDANEKMVQCPVLACKQDLHILSWSRKLSFKEYLTLKPWK